MLSAVLAGSIVLRDGEAAAGERWVPDETPIAIVHDAMTYAVMMATPFDLEDFAIGLSLTEGVISAASDVKSVEIVPSKLGIEVRMWLQPERGAALFERRRTMAGPTGCGLCGVESLEQTQRPAARRLHVVAPLSVADVLEAMKDLEPAQTLGRRTRASHAAGLWRPKEGLVLAREDVGRHNAVDKLAGALLRAGQEADGVLLLTSRVSVELVQKAASMGAPVIAAVSAPTRLAITAAEEAGVTLVAVVRDDGFEIFTHPRRIVVGEPPPSGPAEGSRLRQGDVDQD